MLLTNLLLACGLSTAVGSGLALKENSNYLHHEKPQEQLHLDNKKNAVTGDIELNTWYDFVPESLYLDNKSFTFYCSDGFDIYISNEDLILSCVSFSTDLSVPTINLETESLIVSFNIDGNDFVYKLKFNSQPVISSGTLSDLKQYLTLSDNQNIGGSTTQEVFDVVGDTTTGFIDVLTSAIEDGTELIYNNGNFTFLGVMLLIATGISVVFWIFRLLRGITEGVSR